MTIKMPMDPDLYAAAVKVMDVIEDQLARADRRTSEEEVLGRPLALAYQAWRTLLICKYTNVPKERTGTLVMSAEEPTPVTEPDAEPARSIVERRKLHPWRNPPRNPRGKI